MKKYGSIILLIVVFCLSCSTVSVDKQKNETTIDSVSVKEVVVDWYVGIYYFDADKFKKFQLTLKDNLYNGFSDKKIEQMNKMFKAFRIEIRSNNTAVATFSNDVVEGNLSQLSTANNEIIFKMIPHDEKHKKDVVNIEIKGEELILDPKTKDIDIMFFKRK